MMVNTHYRGQATGEIFNKSGKTDILVRELQCRGSSFG